MDDLKEHSPVQVPPPESVFQREEDELRRWLNKNISDLGLHADYLARLREDHVARGRQFT